MISYLYSKGVLLDDGRFNTPLLACISTSVDMDFAKFLIDHGADINQIKNDVSPLVAAIKTGKLEWVQLIVEYGKANVNQPIGVSLKDHFLCSVMSHSFFSLSLV
jgi:ankyrin repeat protein